MIIRQFHLSAHLPMVLSSLFLLAGSPAEAADLPAGFSETKVAGDLNPTSMTFSPDGRLFVCEKQGLIRMVDGGEIQAEPILDISDQVDSWNERGLMSVCFDPEFSSNGWIYVYYTHNRKPREDSHLFSNNRVSRFTVKGGAAAAGSEKVLVEIDNLSKAGWHNGGGLGFGKDGKLYFSTGENANDANAQDEGNLLGKLMRINKDGSIPSDNPFYHKFKGNRRAIVALGLRNPYLIAVQPGTGMFYISVVGANFEQIERYESAGKPEPVNYGWPQIDGPPRDQKLPPHYRAPEYAYDHGSGKAVALCGGDFYNPSAPGTDAFPANYTGKFFFSDYGGWIKLIDPAKPDAPREDFATGIDRPIDVATAPDGALWYLARAGIPGGSDEANTASKNGSLWRVRWTGGGGPAKLAVTRQPIGTNVGTPIGELRVEIQDSEGKTVNTATDTITLSIAANPGNGKLLGKTSAAAVKGIATFPMLAVDQPGRGYTLQASNGRTTATSAAFDVANGVAPPEITPDGGNFSGPVWVSLSSATPAAVIQYTLDGKDPGDSSPRYKEPIRITADTRIKALARRKGLSDSTMTRAEIRISGNTPYGLDYRQEVSGIKLPATMGEAPPATLSATGIFTDRSLATRAGIVPYTLNSTIWAEHAEVRRWVALPEQGKISFSSEGEFKWPGGTVFVQHFEIRTNEASPVTRRLETRLLVLDESGAFGYGANYRWRPDNSDADLVNAAGEEEILRITDATGKTRDQKWTYPSSGLCFICHTPNAGFVLGPKVHQLNGDFIYPGGVTDNQLRTWNYLRMFEKPLDESSIKSYPHTVAISDTNAPLEDRVRSYLDGNCSHCHRPGGTGAQWDARYGTPLANQGIINGEVRNILGVENAKLVAPGDVSKSLLHFRMASTSPAEQMPPVTRNVPDTVALDVLSEWIRDLGAVPDKRHESH